METLKLKKDLYWCGVQDPNLRVFDVIMETKYGTSYNSFLLKGSEKTVIFETVKLGFFDEYIEELSKMTDVNKIDYIIVSHTEPDHAGSIEKFLEINPDVTIIGTSIAINFLSVLASSVCALVRCGACCWSSNCALTCASSASRSAMRLSSALGTVCGTVGASILSVLLNRLSLKPIRIKL